MVPFLGHAGPGAHTHKSRWWPNRAVHQTPWFHHARPRCPFRHFWPNAAEARVALRGRHNAHFQRKASMCQKRPRVVVRSPYFSRTCVARLSLFLNVTILWYEMGVCNVMILQCGMWVRKSLFTWVAHFWSTTIFRRCGFLICCVMVDRNFLAMFDVCL